MPEKPIATVFMRSPVFVTCDVLMALKKIKHRNLFILNRAHLPPKITVSHQSRDSPEIPSQKNLRGRGDKEATKSYLLKPSFSFGCFSESWGNWFVNCCAVPGRLLFSIGR